MALDIKNLREKKLEISIEELAKKIDLNVEEVKKYEENHLLLPNNIINQIISKFNLDVIEMGDEGYIYSTPSFKAWKFEDKENIGLLNEEYEDLKEHYKDLKKMELENRNNDNSKILKNLYNKKILILDQLFSKINKPSISLTGASSSGKSTMINHMLGDSTLPSNYTPTTSVSTKIIHIEDKPKFMGENNTAIFKISNKQEKMIETHKLHDNSYFTNHLVEMGELNIISEFGNHEGEKYKKRKKELIDNDFVIVCYLDKPILKLCDIWDIPGTNVKTEDDYIATKSRKGADITLYLSTATQFMQLADMQYLTDILKTSSNYAVKSSEIDQFENVFIIASQASNVKKGIASTQTVEQILDDRIMELWQSIDHRHITNNNLKTDFSYEAIRNRGFGFDVLNEKTQKSVKDSLLALLIKIVDYRLNIIREFKENEFQRFNDLISNNLKELRDQEKTQNELEDFLLNKEKNKKKNSELVNFIVNKATTYKESSQKDIQSYLDETLEIENIIKLIEIKNYGKKKKGKEQFTNWFQNEITYRVENILTKYAEKFSEDINDKLEEVAEKDQKQFKVNQFNFVSSFIGTLSSIATIGAFSFYFGTLGNLGGYIFLSQIVSGFSAIGISLGGTATVASTVSIFGGPMTLVVGIAILTGTLVKGIIDKTAWKKDFAKKIVKAYNQKIKPKKTEDTTYKGLTGKEVYIYQSEEFWNETIHSLNVNDFNRKLNETEVELREKAGSDVIELKSIIKKVEYLKFV